MQYKLLACDYDNTLVPFGEGCPRPGVVQAVKQMQKAGGLFVLSTGRSYPPRASWEVFVLIMRSPAMAPVSWMQRGRWWQSTR